MTWFERGNIVTWINKKGIKMEGEIVSILQEGETAEEVLDEKERTKLSTTNLGARTIPMSIRALIKVKDDHGWVTYHTKRLGTIEMKEEKKEVTIEDMWNLLNEMKIMLEQKECSWTNGNTRLRTVGK